MHFGRQGGDDPLVELGQLIELTQQHHLALSLAQKFGCKPNAIPFDLIHGCLDSVSPVGVRITLHWQIVAGPELIVTEVSLDGV